MVDGDGCPSREKIYELANKYNVNMTVYIDYAHIITSDDYNVVTVDIGSDSVDKVIIKDVKKGDIVVTQDYGLAGLALTKKAYVIHTSGKIIDDNNIDQLLLSRYLSSKERKAKIRIKGPSKRTKEDELYLVNQLDKLIRESL